jgi:NADPH2:quinone reductase
VGPQVHAEGLARGVRVIFNPSPGAWAERLEIPADLVTPIRTT